MWISRLGKINTLLVDSYFYSSFFRAYTYMIHVHVCVNVFMYSGSKLLLDPTKDGISHRTHCKKTLTFGKYNMALPKVNDFYNRGQCENCFFCHIQLKFRSNKKGYMYWPKACDRIMWDWSLLNWRKMRFHCGFVAVPVNWNFVVISSFFFYLRTLYIVWSLVRRRVTRLQTMCNVIK